jgi:hypothetical protein
MERFVKSAGSARAPHVTAQRRSVVPWPAVAYSRNHLNFRSFYPSIAPDTSRNTSKIDAWYSPTKIKQQASGSGDAYAVPDSTICPDRNRTRR